MDSSLVSCTCASFLGNVCDFDGMGTGLNCHTVHADAGNKDGQKINFFRY